MQNTLLIIGTVWPEPNSSAAGTRMNQLIDFFLSHNYTIHFACASAESEHCVLHSSVITHRIELNNSSFDEFVTTVSPHVVLFDRFLMEEQFGWRVRENCPDAFTLLDTEDLHSLRRARLDCFKKGIDFSIDVWKNLNDTKREIASIYRCDLSLIISEVELDFLVQEFQIPERILFYLPFILDELPKEFKPFTEREHFVTIGNFLHEPNYNSALLLKTEIWPLIRKKLPKAEMHIYGSYATQKVLQLNQPKERFFIKGKAESAHEVMKNARVCLAPLNFGAGLKGKFFDAMQNGTPSVTTSIGAEGISSCEDFAGFVSNSHSDIAQGAFELYSSEDTWLKAQNKCSSVLHKFLKEGYLLEFKKTIDSITNDLPSHRNYNYLGQILTHQTLNSTKFMSKWIEEKNKSNF